ncbi:hypothetical protein [Saccharopolyspora elongata]|nr:hypothetical protein [Saccharopolyspora elongata]
MSNPQDWSPPPGGQVPPGGQQDRGGMPMMPPMMPPGAGGGQGSGAERPDASGLLDAGEQPWGENPPGLGLPEAPQGADPGGVGLNVPPGGQQGPGGMPMMPPMMPPGAGGGQGSNAERPDASGLLDAGEKPWESAGPNVGEPEAPPEGVPPVAGPQDWSPGQGLPQNGQQVPGGMPMVPPMMPPGAGGQGSNAERPDASGLLDAGEKPWESTRPNAGEPEAPDGAAPGGPVLGMPPTNVETPGLTLDAGMPLEGVPRAAGPQDWTPGESTPPGGQQVPGGMPMVPPGAGGQGSSAERPDASGLLDAGDKPWESAGSDGGEPEAPNGTPAHPAESVGQSGEDTAGPGNPAETPEDHVPVVRRDAAEQDTSAWDVPSDGLPWLVPFAVAARPEESERDRPAPDHALRDDRPWTGAPSSDNGYATWRSAKWAEGNGKPVEDEQPLMCGGPTLSPEEAAAMRAEKQAQAEAEAAAAEAEEEDEKKERSRADLLVRDNSAWGAGPATPPSGVIG